MKANIPNRPVEDDVLPNRMPAMELEGVYLRAMQDISSRLMDALPSEESLWQTLSFAETLLLEAQLSGTELNKVFGNGGVAGFCQSIVDEYNQKRAGEARDIPAAQDPSLRDKRKLREPRGGINLYRKRRATALLIAGFAVLFAVLALWYMGVFAFLFKGSDYYLDELYHFADSAAPVADRPIELTLSMDAPSGEGQVLYADAEGHTLILTDFFCVERLYEVENAEQNKEQAYQKRFIWCVRIRYPVRAGYTKITYVEPSASGTATLTLSDGTTVISAVSAHRSGADGEGYEYMELEVMNTPSSVNTSGGVLTITLAPPRAVEWTRIGMGF